MRSNRISQEEFDRLRAIELQLRGGETPDLSYCEQVADSPDDNGIAKPQIWDERLGDVATMLQRKTTGEPVADEPDINGWIARARGRR